jgi:ribosomal protein L2
VINQKEAINWQNNKLMMTAAEEQNLRHNVGKTTINQKEEKKKREMKVRDISSVEQMIESTYLVGSSSTRIVLLASLSIELRVGNL